MGIYFGTDGLRGVFRKELDFDLAYRCGNALGKNINETKILIGRDTRLSGSYLTMALCCGIMDSGTDVVDVGVCPTAGISYLTKTLGFEYGVVISASHNPYEFNGIKIFDKFGNKISKEKEIELEKNFFKKNISKSEKIGRYEFKSNYINKYIKYLSSLFDFNFNGMKVVLDCSNGSNSNIAEKIFRNKGAKVVSISSKPNGVNINNECGCIYIENLKKGVKKYKADFGFSFDGDGDRLIAVDEKGQVFDGDKIIYVFSQFYKNNNKLKNSMVVGTKHTNMGVEIALKEKGITLIRTEIGDRFVSEKIRERDVVLGGEQSGHIILSEFMSTGDGLLSALFLSYICLAEKRKLSFYFDFKEFNQVNKNIYVAQKEKIIKNPQLDNFIKTKEKELLGIGRIFVRESGTEPCIRIMVETQNEIVSNEIANEFVEIIQQINGKHEKCVE